MTKPPVFILGVPRSGTTLLRTILDSHPAIACGPETPWLGGHQPRSLMSLWSALREEPWGYCKSFKMPAEIPTRAAREFLSTLMNQYAAARGKSRWAEKTPDNALYVDFLAALFPEARFVHLIRDPLDVAVSTTVVAPHRKGISDFLESNLGFGPDVPPLRSTPLSAVLRWHHWNNLIRRSLASREHHVLSYERLVAEPESTVRELMRFIGEPFEASMLDYARAKHDYPEWEWGSADVRAKSEISTDSAGRGKRELSPAALALLSPIAGSPQPFSDSDTTKLLMDWLGGIARPWGLDPPDAPEHAARLWAGGLDGSDWKGRAVAVLGPRSADHVIPWILELLGARVSIEGELAPQRARLRDGLRVHLTSDIPVRADAMFVTGEVDLSRAVSMLSPGSPLYFLNAPPANWPDDPRFAALPGRAGIARRV